MTSESRSPAYSPRVWHQAVCVFVFMFFRPGVDSDWTSVEDSVGSSSVVVPGLDPDTQYQFAVQAVNRSEEHTSELQSR